MNVAGGVGCLCGDLPVFVSDIKPDSIIQKCGRIQVRFTEVGETERLWHAVCCGNRKCHSQWRWILVVIVILHHK